MELSAKALFKIKFFGENLELNTKYTVKLIKFTSLKFNSILKFADKRGGEKIIGNKIVNNSKI